ncbi:MAG: large subunit ribosomal protein L13 [Candidatus Peregrinibacteria bacterium Gr01-1014_25]|nr:MAG: large subunit ribosomal protein L13 [Candidatus Peregrinibacteria bacterium Gr01-1014_25]
MKTTTVKTSAPAWHLIDAEKQVLGKVAVAAAQLLRGKHKSSFSPHQLCGDHVVVVNIAKLSFQGTKPMKKTYYKHTGYAGHLKSTTLENMMRSHPERVIEIAVKGMLPRNKLRAQLLKRLHVFADAAHPYAPQKPASYSLAKR